MQSRDAEPLRLIVPIQGCTEVDGEFSLVAVDCSRRHVLVLAGDIDSIGCAVACCIGYYFELVPFTDGIARIGERVERDEAGPLAFVLGDKHWNTAVRVGSNHAKQVVDAAEKIWKNMSTGLPFSYAFLDESFNNMYQAEQRVGKIIMSFSILAVFIACLGLFGLASFMAEQRTKEIGVRKVLGASVNNIVQMLSKDFLLLVLVASCIAIPLAWFFMHRWLQDFAYRVQIPLWIFAAATFLALLIALLTVSLQALKAALANPVKSLRSE